MLAHRIRFGPAAPPVLIAVGMCVAVLPCQAEDATQPRQIVVRVTREVFDPFVERHVDTTRPVAEVILGTYVSGKARTTGTPSFEFAENPRQATFVVSLKGATVSRTVGGSGPATIYSRAETFFTATKEVRFEPGQGFVAQPAKIAARTRVITEGIRTRRGGLIGRIVSRRAWSRVNELRPQVEAIALQKAQRRITSAFDDYVQTKLARLNQMTDVKPAIAMLLGGEGEPKFLSRTTRDNLEIAVAAADAPARILAPSSTPGAPPVQLFVHNSIFGPRMADVLKRFDATDGQTNLAEQALATVPDVLRERFGLPQLAIQASPRLDYQSTDKWLVVNIGGEPSANAATHVAADADQPRMWTSADGRYSCYAEKVSATSDSVTLKRMNDGQVVTVQLARLSEADRQVALR
jgi:hypothetical protein